MPVTWNSYSQKGAYNYQHLDEAYKEFRRMKAAADSAATAYTYGGTIASILQVPLIDLVAAGKSIGYSKISAKIEQVMYEFIDGIQMIAEGLGDLIEIKVTYDYFELGTEGKGYFPASATITRIHKGSGWFPV